MRRDGDQQLGFGLAVKRGGITTRILETPGDGRIRHAQSRDEHRIDALGAIDRIKVGKRDAVCGGPHDLTNDSPRVRYPWPRSRKPLILPSRGSATPAMALYGYACARL